MNVDFFLPEFSATKIVTWKIHVAESTNVRYEIILCREPLTAMGLDLMFSDNVIIGGEGPYEGCFASMVDVINYIFTSITDKTGKPEESFLNSYVNYCLELNIEISSTRLMGGILKS